MDSSFGKSKGNSTSSDLEEIRRESEIRGVSEWANAEERASSV